jgi:hypothetical protein
MTKTKKNSKMKQRKRQKRRDRQDFDKKLDNWNVEIKKKEEYNNKMRKLKAGMRLRL